MNRYFRTILVTLVFLIFSPELISWSAQSDKPLISSFTMSPDSVDLATPNTKIVFELVATSSTGIASNQVKVILSDGFSNSLETVLSRTDNPIQTKLQKVKFIGAITIPSNLPTGVYFAKSSEIVGLNSDGSEGYFSDIAYAKTDSKVIGAENSLLIRSNSQLNFKFSTFAGPTWNKTYGITYLDPKFNYIPDPIWKENEVINISKYYELKVPELNLNLVSNTPSICVAEGLNLKLVSVGSCSFTVFTNATNDYLSYKNEQSVYVSSPRIKPQYFIRDVPTQSSTKLPLTIEGPFVYGPLGLVIPISETPTVCFAVGTYINIINGGTCKLNYSSPEDNNYIASDKYYLSFEITRSSQSIMFSPPESINLDAKSLKLSANTSSNLPIIFKSEDENICLVSDLTLTLLKTGQCRVSALQAGSTTVAPASSTKIINVIRFARDSKSSKIKCIKNGKVKNFDTKKCPKGFKFKK